MSGADESLRPDRGAPNAGYGIGRDQFDGVVLCALR